MAAADEVLGFWFTPRVRKRWFNATAAFDRELAERFSATYRVGAAGRLAQWSARPEQAVALVIVLDQFPLNMFRGRPESFATEAVARHVAGDAIGRGFDAVVPGEYKGFLYLPYMHSEDLADQDHALELFERAGLSDYLRWARHHRELIRRFGRFPHRNAILGRESTPDEAAYLRLNDAFRG